MAEWCERDPKVEVEAYKEENGKAYRVGVVVRTRTDKAAKKAYDDWHKNWHGRVKVVGDAVVVQGPNTEHNVTLRYHHGTIDATAGDQDAIRAPGATTSVPVGPLAAYWD